MASFTDQISQFNPYIQELPVEAMAQVGMAKQAQYNQGYQAGKAGKPASSSGTGTSGTSK